MSEALAEVETSDPPWSHGDPPDLRHTVGSVGSVRGSAALVKSRNDEHDFDSPNGLAATFVLTNVVGA